METNLKIELVEEKVSKQGRNYKRFKTSDGWMSCFEDKVTQDLVANMGKEIKVNVEERNGFKNITKFLGCNGHVSVPIENVTDTTVGKPAFSHDKRSKQASMIISYTKDMVCSGKIDMKDFVSISKQLIELQRDLEAN